MTSLQANATIATNSNYDDGPVQIPTVETMVKTVGDIAAQLSTIKDK